MRSFETTTFGKWILSGEHSVLRGQEAIVFPLVSKKLHFHYEELSHLKSGIQVKAVGNNASDIESIVSALYTKAFEIIDKEVPHDFKGLVRIQNTIPLGSGLGASSSLCVAFGRWFAFMGYVESEKIYEFSRKLENLFHGESSGVDIAVVLKERPLIFKRPNEITFWPNYFKPNLYLSYSGQRGVTKDCVDKVKSLFDSQPEKALTLDEKMKEVTETLKKSFLISSDQEILSLQEKEQRLLMVIEGFQKAYEVFNQWGLTLGAVDFHIEKLTSLGALACKPTGSGGGGYVLSLWPEGFEPKSKDIDFIKAF